ncbi:MAG: adenylyl-sulfate kinase [Phycisphaerales bacterium JB063]
MHTDPNPANPMPKADNLTWHEGDVSRDDRNTLLGQRGATLWFTGMSGSGKSTVAVALEQHLHRQGRLCYRLDGDNIRHGLCSNLGFTPEDRDENIRRIGEVAKLFADAGCITLCSFVSPYREARAKVRAIHEEADLPFYEVFVDCPIDVLEQRDPKGLYQKARAGEITNMTGLSDAHPFEAPDSPELHLRTDENTIAQSVDQLAALLKANTVV